MSSLFDRLSVSSFQPSESLSGGGWRPVSQAFGASLLAFLLVAETSRGAGLFLGAVGSQGSDVENGSYGSMDATALRVARPFVIVSDVGGFTTSPLVHRGERNLLTVTQRADEILAAKMRFLGHAPMGGSGTSHPIFEVLLESTPKIEYEALVAWCLDAHSVDDVAVRVVTLPKIVETAP